MPKMKTHKGAAKRIKKTGSGKFARTSANNNHFFGVKPESAKRKRRQGGMVSPSDVKRIKEMVTYR
jgi:large subunit ribosomal protein L35